MERLSPLDASFLRAETPSAHMHVGWLSTLKLPGGMRALDVETVRERVAERLHHAPRFRQRVLNAPLVGEPFLVDDPEFAISNHVFLADTGRTAMTDAGLHALADHFLSTPLDRGRPLWQMVVVPRVQGQRAAVLGKVHHALVDGVAAVELGTLLFDLAPEAAPSAPVDWEPEMAGSPLRLPLDSVTDSALDQFRTAARVAALGLSPGRAMRAADTMRRAAFMVAEQVGRPAPGSYLNQPIGPARALVVRGIALERVEPLKAMLGVKLNDLILAIVTGTLRRHATLCEEEAGPLRAMVPVNVRRESDSGVEGNRIVFGFLELPVDEPDARKRVALIRAQTERLKRPDLISGTDVLLSSMGQLPSPVKTRAARLAASPRLYNLVISNVPGPRMPLYAAGARVESIYPVIPLSEGHALAVGVVSYDGMLHFGLHAAPGTLPDSAQLAPIVETATAELEAAVWSRHTPMPEDHAQVASPRPVARSQARRSRRATAPAGGNGAARTAVRGTDRPA